MMNQPLQNFGQTAQRLARNPLGIIALFIVLVYGIAGFTLGFASADLQPDERQPLIWFLVVFPGVVLVAFYRLVAVHHMKLYAPHDFPDPEGFFRALTASEQREKLEKDIRDLEAVSDATIAGVGSTETDAKPSGLIRGLSARHAWVLAEEFAFRELEAEFSAPAQRQVAIGDNIHVDGVLFDKGKIKVVEVKFIRSAGFLPAVAREIAKHVDRIARSLNGVSIIAAIVYDGPAELDDKHAKLKRTAEDVLGDTPIRTELRVYSFRALTRKFGVDEGAT